VSDKVKPTTPEQRANFLTDTYHQRVPREVALRFGRQLCEHMDALEAERDAATTTNTHSAEVWIEEKNEQLNAS